MENIERIVKIAASVLAIVVPCILVSGLSLHLGYIVPFGLNHELVNRDLSGFVVEGWLVGVLLLACFFSKVFIWLGLFIFIASLSFFSFLYARKAKKDGQDWLFAKISQEEQGRSIFTITQWQWCQLGSLFKELSSWFLYPALTLVMIALLTVYPYQKGIEDADKQIKTYSESGCENKDKAVSCTYLIDTKNDEEKIIAKGILVSATETKIALYDNKLEVWPLLNTYMIRKEANQVSSEPLAN